LIPIWLFPLSRTELSDMSCWKKAKDSPSFIALSQHKNHRRKIKKICSICFFIKYKKSNHTFLFYDQRCICIVVGRMVFHLFISNVYLVRCPVQSYWPITLNTLGAIRNANSLQLWLKKDHACLVTWRNITMQEFKSYWNSLDTYF